MALGPIGPRQVYGGNPYSDTHSPDPLDIIRLLNGYESAIASLTLMVSASQGAVKATKNDLDAVVGDFVDGDVGIVFADTDDLNGIYVRTAGVWVKDRDFSIDAAQLAAEAAELAQTAAEAARDLAAGYVNDIVSEKEVPIFSTIDGMAAIAVDPGMTNIYVKGRSSDTDEEGGWFADTDTGSLDTFESDDGRTWYRVNEDRDRFPLALRNRRLLALANNKLMAEDAISIACVGDSMTYGYDIVSGDVISGTNGSSVTRAPVQYPSRLEERIEALTECAVTVTNRGYPGDTAKSVFERWTTNPNTDLAIIMIGINDSLGALSATFAEYAIYLERLIQRHILWGCGVMIITPTATSFNNLGPAQARFGQYARAMGEAYGCPVMTGEEVLQYCLASEVYSDSTHFNQYGYAKLGDAVASYLLSGSLARPVRGISSEVYLNPIRGSEGIGWQRKGVANGSTNVASYSTSDSTLLIGDTATVSLSFYLDAEAADIFLIGQMHQCELSFSGVPSALNRMPLKNNNQRNIWETGTYTVGADHTNQFGAKALAGSFVGRGWKTIVINNVAGATRVLNEVVIAPKPVFDVALHGDKFRPAKEECMVYMHPNYTQTSGALPSKVALTGDIAIPLPFGLRGFGTQVNHFGFYGMVEVTIKTMATDDAGTMPNGITKILLYRNSTGQTLAMDVVYKTDDLCIEPTAAGLASTSYDDDLSGATGLNKADHADGQQQGWLYLTFAGTVPAFFMLEFRSLARADAEGSWMN